MCHRDIRAQIRRIYLRLKRLELQGFKSFVDKTEITFEDGITAVVGPNGSGKSNISDALRWVLGEQSAKTLRGSKMGDVIFAGTQKRSPVGFCRVSLVFDNEDMWLNIKHSEVAVTRKYYKSGESEYYINNSQCRLKDVLELFRDTGVGKEGYSIIGQGQVTNILSSNAAERRMVFEAATGILKYKTRKADAQSRLMKTGENIDRLNDVLEEINLNLESLENQSKQAKEYLECKDNLKKYELARFVYKTNQANERIKKLENEIKEIGKNILSFEAEKENLKEGKNNFLEDIKTVSKEAEELKEKYLAIREEILKSGSTKEITAEKLRLINENIKSIKQQDILLKNELESIKELIALDKEKFNATGLKLQQVKSTYEVKLREHADIKNNLDIKQRELDELKQKRILFLNSVSEVKVNTSKYNTMLEAIKNRLDDIDLQKETVNAKIEELKNEKTKFTDKKGNLSLQKENLEQNKRLLMDKENELIEQKNTVNKSIHTYEVENGAAKSKLNLLQNMQKEYEGYNFAVKNLLKLGEKDEKIKSLILGTVADIIDVKKEYVVAIETALGASLQNIVTATEEDAKELISVLKRNNMGRATFLPRSGVRPSFLNKDELSSMNAIDGVIGCGEELVNFDDYYRPVIQKLLGRTVVVKDIDTAIKLMRKNAFRFQTVTLEGEIIHAGGAMSGGSRGKKSTGILGRSDEITSLEALLADMDKRAKEHINKLENIDLSIENVKEQFAENKQKLKSVYENIDELQNEISIIDAQINSEMDKLVSFNEEMEQLTDNQIDIEDKLKLVSDSGEQSSLAVDEKDIEGLSAFVYELREKNEVYHEQLSSVMAEISGLQKDEVAIKRDLERHEKDVAVKNEQLITNADTVKKLEQDGAKLSKQLDESSQLSRENSAMEEKLKGDTAEKENQLYLLQTKLKENEIRFEACDEALKESTDRKYKIDIDLNKLAVETEMLENDIFERYDLTYQDVGMENIGINLGIYKREIDSLKEHIRQMGNVNLNAIDEYAYTRSRYEQITAQINDLTDSKKDLEDLIAMLQKDMTTQFKEQFKLINTNFERIFKNLFGGGKAELILGKNESVLESDIEIVAQPPGKKLQNISLMSGGEKSLTAIAILFAMLELKPTPFCVLDEIESALDEANVHSFATYLKNYSGKTQFLVITHRRGVMELSDAIYGVAMQEKGVSKVVSIKMPDENMFEEDVKHGVV